MTVVAQAANGREAVELESAGRQPRDHKSGDGGIWAGNRHDYNADSDGTGDKLTPWIGYPRHSGIGDKRDIDSGMKAL